MSKAEHRLLIEMERKNSATESFRFGFGRFLKIGGYTYRFKYINEITKLDLNWCNAYIAVRPNTPMSYSLAKAIKESGKTYIVYFDDDLINRKNSIKWRNKSSKKCLAISDAMFGANPALCEDYGNFTQYHFSINTAVDGSELSLISRNSHQVQFVYAAGKDHAAIFESIIMPILKHFLDEYHEVVHFTFIGVEPKLSAVGYSDNFTFVPLMTLEKYTEFMRTHAFDVGFAPLGDDRFSSMKYFNKYIEYGKFAIAGLYSNVAPYTYVVRDGVNGCLVNNTEQEWLKALKIAVKNIDKIRNIGRNSQEDLRENFSLENIVEELRGHFDIVLKDGGYTEIEWSRNKVLEKIFYMEDNMGKLINQIYNHGIIETVKILYRRIVTAI